MDKKNTAKTRRPLPGAIPSPTEVNVIAYGLLASTCSRSYHWTQALQAALLSMMSL